MMVRGTNAQGGKAAFRLHCRRLADLLSRCLTLRPRLELVMLCWEQGLWAEILEAPLVSDRPGYDVAGAQPRRPMLTCYAP
jgi:hypothetical protein